MSKIKKFAQGTRSVAVQATQSVRRSIGSAVEAAPPEARRIGKRILVGAVIVLVVLIAWRWFRVHREEKRLAEEIAAGPQVRVAAITQSAGEHTLHLIGETRPYQEATLYAKVSGYLKTMKVDKGDAVKAGQVLAVIESLETDQAYEGARAEARNKEAIMDRMNKLFEKHLVSQQEVEQARADGEVATSRFRAAETQKGYETLRAPFAGVVTARFADPGALVQNATTSQTSALPVVTVSTIDHLRVDVFVDQHDASYVAKDQLVEITLTDRPTFKLAGKVSRVSGQLDPRTKMLLTEIDLENEKNALVAGSFVQVALRVKSPPFLQAPVESLVMKANQPFLTIVTPEHKLTYRAVEIAANDGKLLSIVSGVKIGEQVALNVGDSMPESSTVRPIEEGAKIK